MKFFNLNNEKKPLITAEKMSFLPAVEINCTNIYIWNSKRKGGQGIGHISIGFNEGGKETYVSYWPSETPKTYLTTVKGVWNEKEDDLIDEQRKPEKIIKLKNLNIPQMKEELEKIKAIADRWQLLASTPFRESGAYNCIAIVLNILKAGGIEKLAGEEIEIDKIKKDDKRLCTYLWASIQVISEILINGMCYLLCGGLKFLLLLLYIASLIYTAMYILVAKFFSDTQFFHSLNNDNLEVLRKVFLGIGIMGTFSVPFIRVFNNCFENSGNNNRIDHPLIQTTNKTIDASHMLLSSTTVTASRIAVAASLVLSELPFDTFDTFKNLYLHTYVPDGVIIKICKKAKLNENSQFTYSAFGSIFTKKDETLYSNTHSKKITFIQKKFSIKGLLYQEVPGDGHCLYHAVALYVHKDQSKLRKMIAEHLEANVSEFQEFFIEAGKSLLDYCKDIKEGKEWADHLEIEILMRVLKRPIYVFNPENKIINPISLSLLGEPIFVYYNGYDHYDALILKEGYSGQGILEMVNKTADHELRSMVSIQSH